MPSGASFITGYILILPWLSLNGAIMASGIHEASSSLLLASSPGTTPHLQEIFMGRCSEYQYVVNKTPFKQRQKNCTDLWKKFEQAFRYRDPCDVPMDRFDNFTESALHFIPEDKTLFWEQVYPFVLRYSHGGQRFITLGDTLTGYLVDKLNWCGQKEEPGFNYNFCPPWSSCNSSEYSFWRRTSVQVPSDVSHADFWQRYFYKIHQLELDEDRRRALKKRAEVAAEEQQLEWDEDDDWVDMGGPASPPKQQNLANVSTTELTKRLEDQQQIPSDISEAAHQQVTEIDKTSSTTEETKQENITELSQKEHKGLQKATDNTYKDASTSHGNDTIKTPEILISSESCEITGMGRPIVNEIEDKLQGMEKSCSVVSQDTVTAVNASCQKVDASTKPQEEPVSVATESGTPSENVSQEGEETKTDIQTGVSGAESVNSEPELEKEVVKDQTRTETEAVVGVNMLADLKTKERGDLVMVGSDRTTPTSDGNSKDSTSPDDDWEKDFDLDVTEEDLKMAQEAAKMLAQTGAGMDDESEDWENWD